VIGVISIALSKEIATFIICNIPSPKNVNKESLSSHKVDFLLDGAFVSSSELVEEAKKTENNNDERHFQISEIIDTGASTNSSLSNTTIKRKKKRADYVSGVGFSILCGSLGGSTLVPLNYVKKSVSGLIFIPSFAVGVIIMSFVLLAIKFFHSKHKQVEQPLFHAK
jgi:hypothetical protein